MCENVIKPANPADLMKKVRNSLETVRNMLRGEAGETGESREQIRQLEQLEQLLLDQETRLDAVNKVLEEFNYSVAHELFAPLHRISGFSKEIKYRFSNDLDAEGSGYLEQILDCSQQMDQLIEALMQVSRLQHVELHPMPLNLTAMAREILEGLKQEEPEREVTIRIQPALFAEGDAITLKTAVGNLLENAWRFTTPRRHGEIEFGTMEDNEAGRVFYVRDNGIGFDMKLYERLFHPFQRLHNIPAILGKGLGLTAAKRIIERHGGRIWAEGAPEQGATFYFTLPGAVASPPRPPS